MKDALLYIPIICGCALVVGPVQSFALSRLSWELNPHGTTVMSVEFQVAGALGSSLFTGLYYQSLSGTHGWHHQPL
jgi:DHA2 family lincomycin resistance protein-like MFS transporter